MKIIATNKKIHFNYFLIQELEAGIKLAGNEIKSLRTNGASFNDAFVEIEDGEAFVYGLHIKPYEHNAAWSMTDPDRKRKLLLHKKEILILKQKSAESGMTIVPVELYFTDGLVKITIALCKGKKLYDKRETIKARDVKRSMEREGLS